LIIPGSETVPVHVTTAQTAAVTEKLRTTSTVPVPMDQVDAAPAEPSEPVKTVTAPQPLMPPEGFKPSVHTSAQELPPYEPEPQPAYVPQSVPGSRPMPARPPVTLKTKTQISNAHKTTIAALLGLAVVLLGWFLLDRSAKNRLMRVYNEKITLAADPTATELPVDAEALGLLLNAAIGTGMNEARQTVYQALYLAKATDGTDIDARIADFATKRAMSADVREVLIRDVLRRRNNPSVMPALMNYASQTGTDPRFAVAALQAVRFMAQDGQIPQLLAILQKTSDDEVRRAAEDTMAEIIGKSASGTQLAGQFIEAYRTAASDSIRHSLLRMIGRCGGDKALELVKTALAEPRDRVAAIASIGSWRDGSALPLIYKFIGDSDDMQLRARAFDAVSRFCNERGESLGRDALGSIWRQMAALAKTTEEQVKVIGALMQHDEEWSIRLLEQYRDSENHSVADRADRALRVMEEHRKLRGQSNQE
jgi:hypothetical protein